MVKIFISSHGHFASGMKSAAGILFGDVDNITVFDAYVDESSVQEHIDRFWETVNEGDQVFLLSDLHCGSVNQVMYQYIGHPDTTVITGINLSLVLDILSRSAVSPEEIDEMVATSREMLHVVKAEEAGENPENFF